MTVKETLEAIEVLPDDAVIVAEHFAADVTLGRASDLKALADRVPIAAR